MDMLSYQIFKKNRTDRCTCKIYTWLYMDIVFHYICIIRHIHVRYVYAHMWLQVFFLTPPPPHHTLFGLEV